MRSLIMVAVAALALTSITSASGSVRPGVVLWGAVQAGMRPEEVRQQVPGARKSDADPMLVGDGRALLETDGSLAGRPSVVRFYFSERNELLMVSEKAKASGLDDDFFDKMVASISAGHGKPTDCNFNRNIHMGGCRWLGSDSTITMFAGVPPKTAGFVTVNSMSTAFYRTHYPVR